MLKINRSKPVPGKVESVVIDVGGKIAWVKFDMTGKALHIVIQANSYSSQGTHMSQEEVLDLASALREMAGESHQEGVEVQPGYKYFRTTHVRKWETWDRDARRWAECDDIHVKAFLPADKRVKALRGHLDAAHEATQQQRIRAEKAEARIKAIDQHDQINIAIMRSLALKGEQAERIRELDEQVRQLSQDRKELLDRNRELADEARKQMRQNKRVDALESELKFVIESRDSVIESRDWWKSQVKHDVGMDEAK